MGKRNSMIDAAVMVLQSEKKPYDLYQLFDLVTKEMNLTTDEQVDFLSNFYNDLTTSAKFVYVGDNQWDLKANQKIELWEKDGSFYKEYTKVDVPESEEETVKAKPKAKPEVKEQPQKEVVEEPVIEVIEEEKPELSLEEPVVVPTIPSEDDTETYEEEEIFDDFDDFDEDKYNEYMDTYEDQYDD
jgi:DNA-directed RNA polymerase subunit delta